MLQRLSNFSLLIVKSIQPMAFIWFACKTDDFCSNDVRVVKNMNESLSAKAKKRFKLKQSVQKYLVKNFKHYFLL